MVNPNYLLMMGPAGDGTGSLTFDTHLTGSPNLQDFYIDTITYWITGEVTSERKRWDPELSDWLYYGRLDPILEDYDRTPSPIPEPATMLLLATGLVGIIPFRKKFRKNS